jgi:hypothetical protein
MSLLKIVVNHGVADKSGCPNFTQLQIFHYRSALFENQAKEYAMAVYLVK